MFDPNINKNPACFSVEGRGGKRKEEGERELMERRDEREIQPEREI